MLGEYGEFTFVVLTRTRLRIHLMNLKVHKIEIFFSLKVVTNEKGEAVGDVLTIIC